MGLAGLGDASSSGTSAAISSAINSAIGSGTNTTQLTSAIKSADSFVASKTPPNPPTSPLTKTYIDVQNSIAKVAPLLNGVVPGLGDITTALAKYNVSVANFVDSLLGGGTNYKQQNLVNDSIRAQIKTVDDQTENMTQILKQIGVALGQNTLTGFHQIVGLGDINSDLQSQLKQKLQNLQSLQATVNDTIAQIYSSVIGKSDIQKIILYGLISLSAASAIWFIIAQLKPGTK
ncbi:hypothetical protein WSM22_02850 [Cytophagales bacterium WSM2-2]|nr:hypothetical protein WSM22_02850 [Cytophagales bacterium WSM2-2]